MSEPAPRRHRVSSFSDDGNVTSDTSQKCNSEKCIVDFDGSVRHGDTCILKDMDQGDPIKVKPVEDLAALQGSSRRASKNGSPPIQKGRSTVDLPVTEVTVLGLEKGETYMGVLANNHASSVRLFPLCLLRMLGLGYSHIRIFALHETQYAGNTTRVPCGTL